MTAFLWILLVCGINIICGNALLYRDLFSKYPTQDDYYEDYYLKKVPKLKTSPEKVKEFVINHLSWFPVENFQETRTDQRVPASSYSNKKTQKRGLEKSNFFDYQTGIFTPQYGIFNYTYLYPDFDNRQCPYENPPLPYVVRKNWSRPFHYAKEKSSKTAQKFKEFWKKRNFKQKVANLTHPLRYKGQKIFVKKYQTKCTTDLYGDEIPIVHHPKGSLIKQIKTTTTGFPYIETHYSFPRKMKVSIDLKNSEQSFKPGEDTEDTYLATIEGDPTNATKVLETAGGVASDLAGRFSSLWHCVLGSHHVPQTRDVKFYLYTRRNIIKPELLKVNYDIINKRVKANPQRVNIECDDITSDQIADFERISDENRNIIRSNFLNVKAPTKILIHGYTGSYKDSRMAKIKDAYLTNGRYNVIQVDWEGLAAPPCYIRVTHHSKFVGETIAQFLNGLYFAGLNMSLVHLVGFSLGAQVAGFAGNNATIIPVCRITGLDPALPLFLHTEPSGHLDRLDAKFVDVIHTCGGILAMLDPLGHVDFYPNGGTKQPGCEFSNLKCSHSRAPQYFAESISSSKKFTAKLCLTWEEYAAGECSNSTSTSDMGEPCSRRSAFGKYYLLTKAKEPFAL